MKERTKRLEAMRQAAMALSEAKGGKAIASIMPSHTEAEIEAHGTWWRYHSALVALSNQVHEGLEPSADWDALHPHLQGAGDTRIEAREIIAAMDTDTRDVRIVWWKGKDGTPFAVEAVKAGDAAARVSGYLDNARAALRQAMEVEPMHAHLAAELAEADRQLLHAIGLAEGLNVHNETDE